MTADTTGYRRQETDQETGQEAIQETGQDTGFKQYPFQFTYLQPDAIHYSKDNFKVNKNYKTPRQYQSVCFFFSQTKLTFFSMINVAI